MIGIVVNRPTKIISGLRESKRAEKVPKNKVVSL